ncbi:hypothetical protein DB347_20670 [Opitutaceae bacterium EW11]|nr:hypothetical protein DB347_20670 [Opitutaceae bacterium EW11]
MNVRPKSSPEIQWLILSALLLAAHWCPGAKPYKPVFGDALLEPWRWRAFPELSGLVVQCMAEDADGKMWFGTANGLWSYDGIDWVRQANEVGNDVTALCIRPDGHLFVGGGWGISEHQGGRWTRLFPAHASRMPDPGEYPIRGFACGRDGSLWVATGWGALHREGTGWTLYTDGKTAERLRPDPDFRSVSFQLLPEPVVARLQEGSGCRFTEVCADDQGRIWFGTKGGQVLCHVSKTNGSVSESWSIYDAADGMGAGTITSLLPRRDGSLWVAHAGSENASVFQGNVWKTVRLPLFLPVLDLGDAGGKFLETRDGVVWLSARFALYSLRDGQWRKYDQTEVAYPSLRNVVMQSADGALWFGGPNSEVYRIGYQTPRWQTLEDLNFAWESPEGAQWFLHRDGRVVVHEGERWTSYGPEDGVIDTPVAVFGTRSGVVWAAGSQGRIAATSRFDGQKWTRELHEDFSFAIDWRAVFESSDGSVWFGAFVDSDGPKKFRDGILQFRKGAWVHHYQPGRSPQPDQPDDPARLLPPAENPDRPIEKYVCIGESKDGKIWAGRMILACYDGARWRKFIPPPHMPPGNVETMLSTREGDLWLGTRESGAWRYDGKDWWHHQGKDSLMANSVRALAQTADGSIWAVTDRGSSRFDGNSWMDDVLPDALHFPHEGGGLKASHSGQLWVNHYTLYWMRRAWEKSPPPAPDAVFRTVSHQFRGPAPRTSIKAGASVISQPGNLAVLWTAVMPWRAAKDAPLQYSFRLDDQPWSPFNSDRGHSFFTLPHGHHRLEVRARDADFNIDPTPAVLDFEVLPPVWRQAWFVALMVLLGGLIAAQTVRVMREQARLHRAHGELEARVRQRTAELETANRDLAGANRELEAFSYSVSHDLRTPLRSIDGFCCGLLEDYGDKLDDEGRGDLNRVRAAAQRMGQLIEDMLKLSRVTRTEVRIASVDLSALVREIAGELQAHDPGRNVALVVAPNVVVAGDGNLLRIALENLLGNAWKFTSKREQARIEFGVTEQSGERVFFVRDNGAGFDMEFVNKLFGAFQRLHKTSEFPGTGVGLAIVQRVVLRHGGRVWAEGVLDQGATFSFTLGNQTRS